MGRRSQRKTNKLKSTVKRNEPSKKNKIINKKSSVGESLRIKRAQKNSDVKSADHTKMNSAPKF